MKFANVTGRWKIQKYEIERVRQWINVGPYRRERGELQDHIVPNASYVCPTGPARLPHEHVTIAAQGGAQHYRRRRQGQNIVIPLPPGPPSRTWYGVREYTNQSTRIIFQSCHSNYKSTT